MAFEYLACTLNRLVLDLGCSTDFSPWIANIIRCVLCTLSCGGCEKIIYSHGIAGVGLADWAASL